MSLQSTSEKNIFTKLRISFIAFVFVCSAWAFILIFLWLKDISVPLSALKFISWDEYQYLPEIDIRQKALLRMDLISFFATQEKFGYGDFFFQLYSVLSLPFRFLIANDSPWFLFILRIFTLVFMLGSLLFSFKLAGLVSRRPSESQLILLLILCSMPGLFLVYKPFSPDYLSLFMLLFGFLLICLATKSRSKTSYLFGFFCIGIGIATKIYAVLLLPIFYLYALDVSQDRVKIFILSTSALCGGFLAANSSLFFNSPLLFFKKYYLLAMQMSDVNYQHAIKLPGLANRIHAWLDNPETNSLISISTKGISHEFFTVPVLVCIIITIIYYPIKSFDFKCRLTKIFDQLTTHKPYIICFIATTALVITIMTTNRVWTWYLISPIFFMAIGFSTIVTCTKLLNIYIFVILFNSVLMIYGFHDKYTQFIRNRNISIQDISEYYQHYSLPARQIIGVDGNFEHFIVHAKTPLHPILKNFYWSKSFAPYIKQSTKYISWKAPSEEDLDNAYRQGFSIAHTFKENTLLIRK